MANLPLNRENLEYWKNRLSNITTESKREFGELDQAELFRHIRRTIEPVVGDYQAEDMSNFFTRLSLFHKIFLIMPWPKGKVKAPDWMTPPAEGDIEQEREALYAIMERFVVMHKKDPKSKIDNPLLGKVSMEFNSRLQGKHLNHHCEQFGA